MYLIIPPKLDSFARICWFEKAFSEQECDRIIELGLAEKQIPAKVSDGLVDTSIRDSKVAWLSWNSQTDWIFQKLTTIAVSANARYQFQLTGFVEQLQFTEYEPGQFYGWHQDSGNTELSIRKLSLVLLLSPEDEYEGGTLKLFQDKTEMPKARGTVFVFPSYEQHMVTKVTSGMRRSLVAWVSGSPYR